MTTNQTQNLGDGYRAALLHQEEIITELRLEIASLTRGNETLHKLIDELLDETSTLKTGGCARNQGSTQFCAEAVELQEKMRHMIRLDDPVFTGLVEAAKAASHGNYPTLEQRHQSNLICHKAITAYEARMKEVSRE